jgi:hypothetical protein
LSIDLLQEFLKQRNLGPSIPEIAR